MSTTGLEVFDTTIHKTNLWLKEIAEELHWDDRHRAYLALRASLHQVRDLLPVEEAAHLGAQLPMLVRGIYYEGWDPHKKIERPRNEAELADAAREYLPADMAGDYERTFSACYSVIQRQVDPGIINHVIGAMPRPVSQIWQRALV